RRSGTDEEGVAKFKILRYRSDPSTCPVHTLSTWLRAARITKGPVFRPVTRYDKVQPRRLKEESVTLIVKRRAARAGLDPRGRRPVAPPSGKSEADHVRHDAASGPEQAGLVVGHQQNGLVGPKHLDAAHGQAEGDQLVLAHRVATLDLQPVGSGSPDHA